MTFVVKFSIGFSKTKMIKNLVKIEDISLNILNKSFGFFR